jgi:WD40 repeat protein
MKQPVRVPLIGSWLDHRSAKKLAFAASRGDLSATQELIQILCISDDPTVREITRKVLCSLKTQASIDEFCTAVISREDACLSQIAVDCGYVPSDPAIQALFFYITNQYTHYHNIDPETHRPNLAQGYTRSDFLIRTRTRTTAKKNMQCAILAQALMGKNPSKQAASWSSDEWDIVISGLIQDSRWDLLWPLILSAPLPKTVDALHVMNESGWNPDGDEKSAWREIVALLPDAWEFPSPDNLLQKTLGSHDSQTFRLVFSPDGSLVCAGRCDGTILIWSTMSGTVLDTITTGSKSLRFLAFTGHNDRILFLDDEGTFQYWKIPGATIVWSYHTKKESKVCLGKVPRGEVAFISDGAGKIQVLQCENGQNVLTLEGYSSNVTFLTFSSDHQTLAGGYDDGTLCIWNLSTGSLFTVLKGEGDAVRSLVISHEGENVLVLFDHSLPVLWNISTKNHIRTFSGLCGPVICFDATHDGGNFALATGDHMLRLWKNTENLPYAVIPFYKRTITGCSTTRDGRFLVTGDSEGTIRIIGIPEGTSVRDFKGHTRSITAITLSPNGSLIASAGWDGAVKLWDLHSGELIRVLQRYAGPVTALDLANEGSLIAAGFADGSIRLHNRITGDLIRQFETYTGGVRAIALSADGTLLACAGADATLRLWNVLDGSLVVNFTGISTKIWCLAFMPDQKNLISGGWDGDIICWNVSEGCLSRSIGRHTSIIMCCALSPDGHTFATGSNDMTVRLWTFSPSKTELTLTEAQREVRALVFSVDGTLLATAGSDKVIRIYRLPYGSIERIIPVPSGTITAIAFTQDGQALAAGYENGNLVLISLEKCQIIRTIHAHTAAVSGIVTVPGCEEIVTSGLDGIIRIWRLPFTKTLSQTTPDDIPYVLGLARSGTDECSRKQWEFLSMVLSLRFQNEIQLFPLPQDMGAFDIQIAG